jgi:hypothetical protein
MYNWHKNWVFRSDKKKCTSESISRNKMKNNKKTVCPPTNVEVLAVMSNFFFTFAENEGHNFFFNFLFVRVVQAQHQQAPPQHQPPQHQQPQCNIKTRKIYDIILLFVPVTRIVFRGVAKPHITLLIIYF